ncbi:MAG: neutral/alkaline non-lysosomal ceramidase N-terminal domain-containing protein [Verrucomicrobia bacterium]|nr:neutral/alkaline non-lysosomal ceramidase N-terminal domain-containing protein [Verrucomicrobiota bacterium]
MKDLHDPCAPRRAEHGHRRPSFSRWARPLLLVLLAVRALMPAVAAEPEWKAGVATMKITPEQPVLLSGYAARTKPFTGVEQDLFAKALALEDQSGQRAVLVTTDLLGLPAAIAEPVRERITQRTGLRRERILLSSSHTHAGPALRLQATAGAGESAEDAARNVAYTRLLQDKLVEVVVQSLAHLEPAQLAWGSGVAHFAMNRREFTPRGVILGVNPKGPVDRSVPVLRVDSADGQPRAVLIGYACHNTTLTQTNYLVTGDYAGFAQSYVQAQFAGAQAMFMIGCGGDANPYPRGTMEFAREHGASLGKEVCRVLTNKLQSVHGPLTCLLDHAALPLQQPAKEELEKAATNGPSWQAPGAKEMLASLERGEKLPSQYRSPVAVWQFGADLTLVALSGEVVVDYVPLIEQAIGPLQLWIAAYCNDVFGYLPSARVLKEGGYECRGLYTALGWFAPTAQDVLVAKVRELAKQAGRKLPE